MADGVGKTAISTVSGAALDVTDCRSFRTTLTHCATRDSEGHRQGESKRERDNERETKERHYERDNERETR